MQRVKTTYDVPATRSRPRAALDTRCVAQLTDTPAGPADDRCVHPHRPLEANMFRRHLHSAATVTAIAAVALSATSGVASARGVAKVPGTGGAGKKAATKLHRAGQGTTLPPFGSGTTSVALEAFPTGGKGSGTEEVCHQWTIWLNEDQEQLDNATTTVEILDASDQKKADIDAAMDAGCAVID